MHIKFDNMVSATFIRRINRFIAEVELDHEIIKVHVPSTGRLDTVLSEGLPCLLKPAKNPARKTPYSLFLVVLPQTKVCIDAMEANRLTEQLLIHQAIAELTHGSIHKEVTVGKSRFDFVVRQESMTHLIEVKSVNMAVDGTACFPDAPTERGTRHLQELAEWQQKDNIQTHVIFVVQREDADGFSPCIIRDPDFSNALRHADRAGTKIHVCLTSVTEEKMAFQRWLPLRWSL